MKYVIVQGDGMGDRRGDEPGATTPLEAARTPAFDHVAGSGAFGLVHTIPPGYPPGSDVGNLCLFGYDPERYYTGRSPLEAAAMGVKLGPEDVAFRMNLVTLEGEGDQAVMADYAGGHIDSESSARIVEDIGAALADEHVQFYPGVAYRHLMVWRKGLLKMETTPPHDISDRPIAPHMPRGEGAELLNRIMQATRDLLADHPVNRERMAAGRKPVNMAWLWGQGTAPQLPAFQEVYGLRGACLSPVDLVRGVATYAGFDVIDVPGMTDYIDTDYAAQGRYALRALEDHDLVFVHVESPDESGHMGSREEKIKAIERIDELIVGPMLEGLPALGDFRFLITSDHATPWTLKTHTPDPVPFAMAAAGQLASGGTPVKYGEAEAERSGNVVEHGYEMMRRLLDYSG